MVAVAVVAAITTYLTAPRPGGTMDPEATSSSGAHALVTLLRDAGVEVVVANSVADVERATRPDALLLVAQTQYLGDNSLLVMARDKPTDPEAFLRVSGVGQAKLERYGDAFMNAIALHG